MSENTNQQETVYWDPNSQIEITGLELATLIQILDLQYVNLNAIPFSALAEIVNSANQVKSAIIERMNNQGLLSSKPLTSDETEAENVEVLED
jgi:hypothetical protein